jgi:hypothetical protein
MKPLSIGNRHHCRACGALICSNCSRERLILRNLGYSQPQRVCDRCVAHFRKPLVVPVVQQQPLVYQAPHVVQNAYPAVQQFYAPPPQYQAQPPQYQAQPPQYQVCFFFFFACLLLFVPDFLFLRLLLLTLLLLNLLHTTRGRSSNNTPSLNMQSRVLLRFDKTGETSCACI